MLIQPNAKRWEKRHRVSAEGCKPDVIQWLIVNCYAWYTVSERNGHPNANFANGRKWAQITVFVIPNAPFVIPNVVRNLAPKKKRDSSLRSE